MMCTPKYKIHFTCQKQLMKPSKKKHLKVRTEEKIEKVEKIKKLEKGNKKSKRAKA